MRGSLGQSVKVVTIIGITPACAGTTRSVVRVSGRCAIQPRVCGDYSFSAASCRNQPDTTPRVRGLQPTDKGSHERIRYNPACAGTTVRTTLCGCTCPIQPRVCGDYREVRRHSVVHLDTTPRVRGLPPAILLVLLHRRYNPACAGTTPPSAQQRIAVSIQPRVCGDYALCCLIQPPSSDTTPRVRGLRVRNAIARLGNRYNPACAGTTSMTIYCWLLPPIQPRVCGDYVVLTAMALSLYDTTPRVRGLLTVIIKCRRVVRYNPACAGTTRCPACSGSRIPIQPRVCGDYSLYRLLVAEHYDTTPRVRGLPRHTSCIYSRARYNPACAGTTCRRVRGRDPSPIQPRVCGDYSS